MQPKSEKKNGKCSETDCKTGQNQQISEEAMKKLMTPVFVPGSGCMSSGEL